MRHPLVAALMVSGCVSTAPLPPYSPVDQPLGYPVLVRSMGDRCSFQVQDMLGLSASQLSEWMHALSDKSRLIDIVDVDASQDCVREGFRLVKRAGFAAVSVRELDGLSYPSGQPPAQVESLLS